MNKYILVTRSMPLERKGRKSVEGIKGEGAREGRRYKNVPKGNVWKKNIHTHTKGKKQNTPKMCSLQERLA